MSAMDYSNRELGNYYLAHEAIPPEGFIGEYETDPAKRCNWVYAVCGGLLWCMRAEGHHGPWHGNRGKTWSHSWREDDEDAKWVSYPWPEAPRD